MIHELAYKIPTILSTLQTIFYNAWSVSAITEFDKDEEDGFIGNIYFLYACMSTIGCSVVLLLNKVLAKMMYANDFYEAWICVSFLLLGVIFNGIALFEGYLFTAVKKTKMVSKTTLIGATANTIANFVLIPFIGAVGAAFATMLGYFTVWLVRTICIRDIIKMKVNWTKQIVCIVVVSIQVFLALITLSLQFLCLILLVSLQYKSINKVLKKVLVKVKR